MIFSRNIQRLAWVLVLLVSCIIARAADYNTTTLNQALAFQDGNYGYTNACIGLRVQYVGTLTTPTVTCASTGLNFAAGGGNDSLIGSSGAVTFATYTTFGTFVQAINASPDWQAILVGLRPSQSTAASCLVTFSASGTGVTNPEGMPIYYSTSGMAMVSGVVGPEWTTNAFLQAADNLLNSRKSTPTGTQTGPVYQNGLLYISANLTFSTGASTLQVYAVQSDLPGATELLLWQQPGAATTVASTIPVLPKQAPIKAPPGWRIIVQYSGSGTTTAGTIQLNGLSWINATS